MTISGIWRVGFRLVVTLVVVGGFVAGYVLLRKSEATGQEKKRTGIPVLFARPLIEEDYQWTVSRPADVEAYFRINIDSRVAGEVKKINVAPGAWVEKGDPLVRLSVPDLETAEVEKANLIKQRESERYLAHKKALMAAKAVITAQANVAEKETQVARTKADTQYRYLQFKNLDDLWRSSSVDKITRDAAEKNWEAAKAAEEGALAAISKARAEKEEAEANREVMEADEKRTEELIKVAKSDHEKAQAMLAFADIRAPFRGRVVDRFVNPGSFVQNASTGHPTPILTLERTDIVTVGMRVPDNYVSYVKESPRIEEASNGGTDAVIELDQLPDVKIKAKVTRMSWSLVTAARDRTMKVEVDLWNNSPEEYQRFRADPRNREDLKRNRWPLELRLLDKDKGGSPEGAAEPWMNGMLRSDMYGQMTLVLKTFKNASRIPSEAVLHERKEAKDVKYLYIIENGKAKRIPVKVPVDDGKIAVVQRLDEGNGPVSLKADVEVIVSNQEELSEGTAVDATAMPDWPPKNGNGSH